MTYIIHYTQDLNTMTEQTFKKEVCYFQDKARNSIRLVIKSVRTDDKTGKVTFVAKKVPEGVGKLIFHGFVNPQIRVNVDKVQYDVIGM